MSSSSVGKSGGGGPVEWHVNPEWSLPNGVHPWKNAPTDQKVRLHYSTSLNNPEICLGCKQPVCFGECSEYKTMIRWEAVSRKNAEKTPDQKNPVDPKMVLLLRKRGLTLDEIGKQLGIAKSGAGYWLDKLGYKKGNTVVTTNLVKNILERYDAGLNYTEIAQELGISIKTAWKYCRLNGRNKRNDFERPQKVFYVYLRKNDELIAMGTARECAKRMRITLLSFRGAVSRCRKGTQKNYSIFSEEIRGAED